MNRRSLMAVFGLAPAVASASGVRLDYGPVPTPPMSDAASQPGMPSNEVMRLAYKAGLFPEDEFRRAVALEHGCYGSVPAEPTIQGYRSFSAVAKQRLLRQEREAQAWQRFWDGDEKNFYALSNKARELLGL